MRGRLRAGESASVFRQLQKFVFTPGGEGSFKRESSDSTFFAACRMEISVEIEDDLIGAAVMAVTILFADRGFLDVFKRRAVLMTVLVGFRAKDRIEDALFRKVNQLLFIRRTFESATVTRPASGAPHGNIPFE